ncbi:hypothetical protein P5673_000498 [Acropora cervicornis]|uniref:BZIP domain-containing protein n=1 Tax=Acropora cervicornis TaxID=6130 RepID=A0AAD9R779_ACRCE|nr:uncharacterized protein LOC114952772 [Acropora millepora]KAK2574346.1 hypothetical protein P5673_000498 [Acropora cervicornis]
MNFTIYTDPGPSPVCLKVPENSEGGVSSATSSLHVPLPLTTWSTAKTNLTEGRLYKTDGKRRARNVESSRKYRKRRRERFQSLEHANKRLQEQIEEVERQLHQLNYAFGLFVQHAECCGQCSNIRLGE